MKVLLGSLVLLAAASCHAAPKFNLPDSGYGYKPVSKTPLEEDTTYLSRAARQADEDNESKLSSLETLLQAADTDTGYGYKPVSKTLLEEDTTYLSRAARQADEDNEIKLSALEIQNVTALTLFSYETCILQLDPSSDEIRFMQKFGEAFRSFFPPVEPEEKILVTARKIAAKVITDLGCAGRVSYRDPDFVKKLDYAFITLFILSS